MRARSVLISLVCAVSLTLSACSGSVVGSPQLPGGAGGAGTPSGAPQNPSGLPGNPASTAASLPGGGGGEGSTGLPSADGGDNGLPTGLPTDLSGFPTDLGAIPGLSPECAAVLNLTMAIGLLFAGAMLGSGQALTQQQVDQAFAQMGGIPAELQQPMKVLHDAASQAVGKPLVQAGQIFGSDDVSKAMDALSDYADAKCGGS